MDNYTWDYIQKHPQETKRLLGIDYEQLGQLIEQGKLLHQRKQEEIEKNKIRLIKAGGGNHPKLSEEEQIILMFVYLRHHLSFQLLGLLFHISESTAHNSFNYWQNIFQGELPQSLLKQEKKFSKLSMG
jgi:Helix-turn-helix of DDE superfamily endonuclease